MQKNKIKTFKSKIIELFSVVQLSDIQRETDVFKLILQLPLCEHLYSFLTLFTLPFTLRYWFVPVFSCYYV